MKRFAIFGAAVVLWAAGCASDRSGVGKRPDSPGQPGATRVSSPASASVADPDFLEQYAATFRFRLGTPTAITCVPGGESVLFLRSGPRSFVQDLYEFDIASGTERVLLTADTILAGQEEHLTAEELARRERTRTASRGIASYSLSKDGRSILVPLSGRLFIVDRKTGAQRELSSENGYPIDARFSPDASSIACVRDGEVYVTDVGSGVEKKITSGAGGTIENGLAEFVAQEEMDRREGYWWSPDGAFIAFQQTDTAGMEIFNITDPLNPEKEPQSWPYPRAGKANAKVRLAIASTRNGSTQPTWVQWDATKYPYLARVDWPEKGPMTILVQSREQTEQVLYEVEPTTGGTRELLKEHDDAWLNLFGGPKWLDGGEKFLWVSEASGEPALELRGRDGALARTVTPRGLGLVSLVAVDWKRGCAYVMATNEGASTRRTVANPLPSRGSPNAPHTPQVHAFRVWLDAEDARRAKETPVFVLSGGPGVYRIAMAEDFSSWVLTKADADGYHMSEVHQPAQTTTPMLRSAGEEPSFRPKVEFVAIAGGEEGRSFQTAVLRPRNFERGVRYPVILSAYVGPGHQHVTADTRPMLMDQWFADHGFIVARIDGRGTPARGRDWERVIKGNLIDVALEDQIDGLKALGAQHPEMDLTRVGVYGWSFGGYFSAMAAMRRPDVFKCAVAGAPVADWRDYDTHYTERFMGLPDQNKEGYDKSSVLTYCKDLEVPLLIIHGTADDNVYFMHSLKICDALFRAGKPFDFLALPGFTHMVPDPVVTKSLYGRIADFFVKNLQNSEPRP